MSEPIIDAADHHAESLAAQMRTNPGADFKAAEIDPVRSDELDAIFNEATKTEPAEVKNPDSQTKDAGRPDADDTAPLAEEKVEIAEEKPATEEKKTETPAKKSLLDLAAEPAAKKDDEDPYEKVKLRADASPKTRESFEALKSTAREREKAALARAEEAEKKALEASEKAKTLEGKAIPDDVDKELKELRSFRAQFDRENDPAFKSKYDSKLDGNYAAIYAKLQEHGLKPEVVEQLKGLSRAERDTAIENFLEKVPTPASKRFIESKLVDNLSVAEQRSQELAEARSKADELLAQRAKAPAEEQQQRQQAIAGHLKPVLQHLDWIHVRDVPATATPAEKAALEASNQFAESAQEMLRNAILDDSPKTRAESALAVPLAHHFKARADRAETELASVKKELEGIRRASATSRTARTSANPTPAPAPAKPAQERSSEDTLDQLFAEANKA